MEHDPLAAHRRKPAEIKLAATNEKREPEGYIAFGGKDRVERLRIRRAMAPTRAPRYLHLQDLAYDGNFGTSLVLVFDFMMVMIRGKNLQGMIAALENSTVDFIQEYHSDLWAKPADDAPLIESIEIVINGEGAESEKMGETKQ